MKKITVLTLFAVSSFAVAGAYTVDGHSVSTVRNQNQLSVIPPGTPVMPARAAVARRAIATKALHFVNGKAHLQGTIRGLNMAAYRFYGQAGQEIKIVPNSKNYAMEFALFDPQHGMRFGAVHRLPENSEYEVRIVQTRKNAAYNKKAYRYDVTVYTDGRAAAQAVIPVAASSTPAATITVHSSTTTVIENAQKMAVSPAPVTVMTAAHAGTGQSHTYQCHNGSVLNIEYFGADSSGKKPLSAVVHAPQGDIHLNLNPAESMGANIVFTDANHTLHLISKEHDIATAFVLSFDINNQPSVVSCQR